MLQYTLNGSVLCGRRMRILLLSLLTLVTATFGSAEIDVTDPVNCFPYGTAKLSCALRVPDVPLNQW